MRFIDTTHWFHLRGVSTMRLLSYLIMRRKGIEEIYTVDNHFGNLDVRVVR